VKGRLPLPRLRPGRVRESQAFASALEARQRQLLLALKGAVFQAASPSPRDFLEGMRE